MAIEVVVPQVGEAIAEVTLVTWLKSEGDYVRRGEPLFEVDTDKAIVEVEAFAEGTLTQILVPEGGAVMPQQVVALLTPEGEAEAAPSPDAEVVAQAAEVPPPTQAVPDVKISPVAQRIAAELGVDLSKVQGTGPGRRVTAEDVHRAAGVEVGKRVPPPADGGPPRVLASPKARRLAKELGVDLHRLQGTGIDGMIVAEDVQAALVAPRPSGPRPLSKLRRSIATRMQLSKQTIPHFYLMVDVDMTQAQHLRTYCGEKLGWEQAPTYTDIVVRACALALADMPALNVTYADEGMVRRGTVGIGIAVSVEDGLIVPVLPTADQLSLRQTSEAARGLIARAREGRLRGGDLSQKSMVVSNLGMYGVDAFVAIIDPPDPMILAVGRIADRVVPVEGQAAIRPMSTLTLSVDHRALDGVAGSEFLTRVKDLLESPFELLR